VLGDPAYESLARKGETMTIAEMVAYAYDQIDQARTELEAVAKGRHTRVSILRFGITVNADSPRGVPNRLSCENRGRDRRRSGDGHSSVPDVWHRALGERPVLRRLWLTNQRRRYHAECKQVRVLFVDVVH
jgi:hypothetical protein